MKKRGKKKGEKKKKEGKKAEPGNSPLVALVVGDDDDCGDNGDPYSLHPCLSGTKKRRDRTRRKGLKRLEANE